MDPNSHFHNDDEMEIIEIGDSDGEGDVDSNSTGVQGESGHNSIRNGAGRGDDQDQSEESKGGGKTGDSEKIVIDPSSDNNKVISIDSTSNSNSCSSNGLGGGEDKSNNNSVKNDGFENLRTVVVTATSTGFKNVPKHQPSASGQTASQRYLIQKQQQQHSKPLDGGLGGLQPLFSIPDDTFLIEAPSFTVPYIFEQSGEKQIKDALKELEQAVKVEKERKIEAKEELNHNDEISTVKSDPAKSDEDYFQSPVGKLLMGLGMNLVQEYVQVDLLKMQKQKAETEKRKNRAGVPLIQTQQNIISLKQNIEESKENNEPFRHKLTKCSHCNFKSESEVVMATHLETPHIKNDSYRCNYCLYTTKIPQKILFHTEAEHCIKSKLERAPSIHQCPNCVFEDNSKAKLTRHLVECTKRFKIEKNLEPPVLWNTPGKFLKIPKNRLPQGAFNNSAFMSGSLQQTIQQHQRNPYASTNKFFNQYQAVQHQQQNKLGGSNLPTLMQASKPKQKPLPVLIRTNPKNINSPIMNVNAANLARGGMMINNRGMPQTNVNYQLLQQMINSQMLAGAGGHLQVGEFLNKIGMMQNNQQQQQIGNQRNSSQPSISITPIPNVSASQVAATLQKQQQQAQPQVSGQVQSLSGGKTSFVLCEICDGYIADLDQLRNHMQWIHKMKIHPKMIHNKPPLNCKKCQFRFFTDQGLERHLLASHGLVTSSMQDAANKGQDSGRCPLCGKVYQWRFVSHIATIHNLTLRPAHLSYKCTVCAETFGTYKLFESHVYSTHSFKSNKKNNNNSTTSAANSSNTNSSGGNENKTIATNVDVTVTVSRNSQMSVTPSSSSNPLNKQFKINDEITITPLPLGNASAFKRKKVESSGSITITPQFENNSKKMRLDDEVQIIEINDTP